MSAPSFSFTLTPDPTAPSAIAATPSAAPGPVVRPAKKHALLAPPRRDGKGGFARLSGDELLEQKLQTLLELSGLPWAPRRGAALDDLRHMNHTGALRAFARAYIGDAVRTYLPELRLEDVNVTQAQDTGVVIEVIALKVRDPSTIITAARPLG